MSVNTFSKRTEIDLRSIQLRAILVWMAPNCAVIYGSDVTADHTSRARFPRIYYSMRRLQMPSISFFILRFISCFHKNDSSQYILFLVKVWSEAREVIKPI